MNITGKFYIFVEDKKGQENSLFKTFSTTISTKKEDGTYINKRIDVRFDKESYPSEVIAKFDSKYAYELDVTEAWLGVRSYVQNENEVRVFYLYIKAADCKSKKKINKPSGENDLPF